ncbi:MAG: VWA domain-containing protein [Candidatus Hydrogenedentes bacterium]|nr:VWA domain-containing protein [Candidatus Hydrogenedentota bacterium]
MIANVMEQLRFHTLMHPWVLWFALAIPLLIAAEWLARAPGAVTVSTGETLARIRHPQGLLLRRLPAVARAIGLLLLLVALARPLQGLAVQKDEGEVIDIMLCIDVSASMSALDIVGGRIRASRLDVTKEAVTNFISNRKQNPEQRFGLDRMGLVLYAKYAWTQTPLTVDYDVLEYDIQNASIDMDDTGKATAIGSALGLAVSKLRKSEAKAKVIILLTDGRNNFGDLDPFTAAQIAKEFGIKVYTIAAGSSDDAVVPQSGFAGLLGAQRMPIDTETLERIASITEGRFFRATDYESLEGAYDEINQLETTTIELGDYYEYKEAFVPWAVLGGLFVMGSIAVRRTWFEPVP